MENLPSEIVLLVSSFNAAAYATISRLSRRYYTITRRLVNPKRHFSYYVSEPFAEYLMLPNGLRHGAFRSYYDAEKTRSRDIRYYNMGIPDGDFVEFDESGQEIIRGSYLRGLFHGRFTQFRSNGSVCYVVNYKNGILEGPQTHYYDNGRVHNYYIIKQNKYTVYQEYLPDGTLNHHFNG
ncbi:antitoxin component YwqK [Faustovirus]|nr:hypothetical protein F-LCD7_0333 [Faustovirus]QJX72101.1 antitoxin component YwqK [Faustovirus]QJX72595.1 antitoxin component YwqK [Faustovirus]QJX73092.1 antitoxin component YwqK [Faustovirus]QJX73599.1 antitoxin component YwqK [Faustovirus]